MKYIKLFEKWVINFEIEEYAKEYFEQIKANKLKDSLRILGINPNIDSIQTLIETTNKRIKKLENKRTFNKEEVEI